MGTFGFIGMLSKESVMVVLKRVLAIISLVLLLATPSLAAKKSASGAGGSDEALKAKVGELKKNPANARLREEIIKTAAAMKTPPAVPEEAEKSVIRGTTFLQKAKDANGYKKAIEELEAAVSAAPWLAVAYYNLGLAQEKAGQVGDALQSFRYYLEAAPNAKNARDVKNKTYELEAVVEDLQASKVAAAQPAPVPVPAVAAATTAVSSTAAVPAPAASLQPAPATALAPVAAMKPSLDVEPAAGQLMVIKMPPADKKSKLPNFIGSWFFKETLRGEELTINAFDIAKNAAGDLAVTPPKRAADSYATITQFEINDKKLKLQLRWKMKSVVGYWKTETYELSISEDGKQLTGSHNQKSIGGRNIDMDRVLFRQ
jgi:tetratricopeptide (TPR) repeat protein